MAERVLLTGATGFVGRQVVGPLLARGVALHAVSRRACPPIPGVTWHRADLLADGPALVRDLRPTLLIHAAWFVEHGRFWTAPENHDWLAASDRLARAFVEAGGRRILGLGTCAEYADVDGDEDAPWPETRRIAPATPYGRAKAELAARLASLPVSVAWARLFHLFGPGEHPDRLVPSVARALAEGREARISSGRPVRDVAPTPFVGAALAALALSAVTGPVNVATGEGRSIAAVARVLAEAAGRPDLLRLGALPDRPGDVPRMVADVTRLRREVGFADAPEVEAALRAIGRAQRSGHVDARVDGGRDRD